MNPRSDEELDYYATIFKKIRNKKYEFFVISRIVHLLNDRTLEFTTQQLVRTDKGRFLLDLYFPQLKFAIEVDEGYHTHDRQVDKDKERDKAVVEQADVDIKRIAITGKSFDDVSSRIDEVVLAIQQKKKALQGVSEFVPFVYGQKYDTEYWLGKGGLSASDDARFRTHVDVARLFGKNFKGHQRATIRLDDAHSVWFPKLYENGDWNNEISRDGRHILMRKVSGGKFNSKGKIKKGEKLYVFAHHRDEFGKIYYAFKGIFEVRTHRENRATFSLVCDTIRFDAGRTQPA